MGMFDYISGVGPQQCQGCGEPLDCWQSKDGECYLAEIPYWHVRNFYTYCSKCGMWHEYTQRLQIDPPMRPLSDYQLRIRPKGDPWGESREVPHVSPALPENAK